MSNLEKMLKDMMYGVVGAAATVAEQGGKLYDSLVEKGGKVCGDLVAKGQDAVNRNREYGEELKRKAKDAVEQLTTVEIDVTKLTPEQRAELRRQMDALDQTETEAASDEEPVKDAAPAEDAEAQEQHEDENANG